VNKLVIKLKKDDLNGNICISINTSLFASLDSILKSLYKDLSNDALGMQANFIFIFMSAIHSGEDHHCGLCLTNNKGENSPLIMWEYTAELYAKTPYFCTEPVEVNPKGSL
jgi:hypothetical protein